MKKLLLLALISVSLYAAEGVDVDNGPNKDEVIIIITVDAKEAKALYAADKVKGKAAAQLKNEFEQRVLARADALLKVAQSTAREMKTDADIDAAALAEKTEINKKIDAGVAKMKALRPKVTADPEK
jgi:hypothetical protein